MKIREHLKAFKAALKAAFSRTVYDAAACNGLAIEYLNGMPAKYDGHLDPHEMPRFIALNPELPEAEKAYVIAREIGRYGQRCQGYSFFMDRPWKWDLLANAPTETRDLSTTITRFIIAWHRSKHKAFARLQRATQIRLNLDQFRQTFNPELDIAKHFGRKILRPQLALAQKFPFFRRRVRPTLMAHNRRTRTAPFADTSRS